MTRSAAIRRNRAARQIVKSVGAIAASEFWPWSAESARKRVGQFGLDVNWSLAAELLNRKGAVRPLATNQRSIRRVADFYYGFAADGALARYLEQRAPEPLRFTSLVYANEKAKMELAYATMKKLIGVTS